MSHDLRILLADKIKKMRMLRGLSQRALAQKLGKGNAAISSIENGKMNVTINTIEEIASALAINPIELFSLTDRDLETPEIIKRVKLSYPQISSDYLQIFTFMYRQGLSFSVETDYYYLWLFINSLIKKDKI